MRQNEQPNAPDELRRHAVHINLLAGGSAAGRELHEAPPTAGRWVAGDIRWAIPFVNFGAGWVIGWVCVESGEPGVWVEWRL